MEFSSLATRQKIPQRSGDAASSCLEVVKQLLCKFGFMKEVAEVVSLDPRKSTACLYQKKWTRFLHWCCGKNITPCKATIL